MKIKPTKPPAIKPVKLTIPKTTPGKPSMGGKGRKR